MRTTVLLALLSLCVSYSYNPFFTGVGSWKQKNVRRLQLNAKKASTRRPDPSLSRQRSKIQKGSQRGREKEEENEDGEENLKEDEVQDFMFPPDKEFWEESTKSGFMEELYPLPQPNPNVVLNDHTNVRFTKDDADALITLEDLARGYRRPALMPDSEEERLAYEAEETDSVGYPIYDFQKQYVVMGFFDSDDDDVLQRRGDLFDYHVQWARRTQLTHEIRIRTPFISDASITSVFESEGEREGNKELLSAKVLVDDVYTLLDDDRLKPVGQALLIQANDTADLRQYLSIEPLQRHGVLTSPGWLMYELRGDEPLTSFNASLASDVFRPYYVMGTESWNLSQALTAAHQIASASALEVLARRCEEETALLVQQIGHLTAPLAQNKRRRHLLHVFSADKSRTVNDVIEEVARRCEQYIAQLRALTSAKSKPTAASAKKKGGGSAGKEVVYEAVKEVLVERWKLHLLAHHFLTQYSLYQYQHADVVYPEGMGEGTTLLLNQAEMDEDADVEEETGEAGDGRFLYNRLEDLYKRESGGDFSYRGRSRVVSYSSVFSSDHDGSEGEGSDVSEEEKKVVQELTSFLVRHNLDGSSWRHIGVQMVVNGATLSDVRRFLHCDALLPHFTTPFTSSEEKASGRVSASKSRKAGGEVVEEEVNEVNGLPKTMCHRISLPTTLHSEEGNDNDNSNDVILPLLPTRHLVIAPINIQDVDGLYRLGTVLPTSDAVGDLDPDESDSDMQQFIFTNIRELHDMDTQDFLKVENPSLANDVINRQENYRVLNLLKRSGVGALFREFNENAVDKIESADSLIEPLIQAAIEKREAAGLSEDDDVDWDQRKAVRGRRGKKKTVVTSEDDEEIEETLTDGDSDNEAEEVEEEDIELLLLRSGRPDRRKDEGRPMREDYDSGDSGMGDW